MNLLKAMLNKISSEALNAKKISNEEYRNLVEFADTVADKNYIELNYEDFDSGKSQGMLFVDLKRYAEAVDSGNPVVIGSISEELQFDIENELTLSYTKISSIDIYSHDKVTKYTFNDDYEVEPITGVVTRLPAGLIPASETVLCVYDSNEASGDMTSFVQTNSFSIGNATIKAIKVDSDDENIEVQISKNNLDFYTISSYNSLVTSLLDDSISLRVATEVSNKIRKVMVIFDKNLN